MKKFLEDAIMTALVTDEIQHGGEVVKIGIEIADGKCGVDVKSVVTDEEGFGHLVLTNMDFISDDTGETALFTQEEDDFIHASEDSVFTAVQF